MTLYKLINRKLAPMPLLLAMLLLVTVFNVHTDKLYSGSSKVTSAISVENICSDTVLQSANLHDAQCIACELMALGAGNAQITPAILPSINATSEPAIARVQHTIHPVFFRTFPSRASPV